MENQFFSVNQEELLDVRLYQAGSEQCRPNQFFGPVKRQHYLFHFIFSGVGKIEVVNSQNEPVVYALHENQGFLCSPGQTVSYGASGTDPWAYAWAEFDGLHVNRLLAEAGLTYDAPVFTSSDTQSGKMIQRALLTLVENPGASTLVMLSHSLLFLDSLQKGTSYKLHTLTNHREADHVQDALAFIEKFYADAINSQDIADFCRLNRNYLSRIFKGATTKSLQQFLIDFRLVKALDLLRNTQFSIEEIAARVGYNDPLYFSKTFQKHYGTSPSKWRKQNQY